MATEKQAHRDVELSQLDKLQNWYEENANIVNIVVGAILVLILAIIAYKNWYQPKRELAAQDAIFKAQYWFDQDSILKALNDPTNGFLTVIEDYGSTKVGNLAKYYAGLSYYDLGDFANAEIYLAKFNPKGDEILGGLAIATLADAQMENKKQDVALKNYKKAAEFSENKATTPFLLLKAGMAYDYFGKSKEALVFFTKLKNNYPNTNEANEAEKYIGKIEAQL